MQISNLKTILLVDADTVTVKKTAESLKNFGFQVIPTLSGEAAIRIIHENTDINLVLLDIDLQDSINGPDTAEKILAFKNIPIIFHTDNKEQKFIDRVKAITHYGYILKNTDILTLKSSIEMALELFNTHYELQYRNSIDNAISQISNIFIAAQETDYTRILQILGESFSVNRSYIFRVYNKGNNAQNIHEWCAAGTLPQIEFLQDLDTSTFPWWMNQLSAGKTISINHVDNLPPEAANEKEMILAQQIKSLAVVPIFHSDTHLWGFMGFDDTEKTRDWDGHEIEILHQVSDMITNDLERAEAEENLQQRENYLSALNQAKEILLKPESKNILQQFVTILGSVARASRTYIFLNHTNEAGELLMSQKAEFCSKGIEPQIDNPDLQNLGYKEIFSRWQQQLSSGNIIDGKTESFPQKEQDFLEIQDIKAILIIPIIAGEEFSGFIGFDNCLSDNEWNPAEKVFLRVSANDLALYLHENAARELLRFENKRFHATMDALDAAVYVADLQTYELLFMNKYAKKIMGEGTGSRCSHAIETGNLKPFDFYTNHLLPGDGQETAGPYIWEFQDKRTKKWYQCRDQAIYWPDGRLVRLEIATDITQIKLAENKIENLLEEKDMLLKEVHHRIKNNMAVLRSLLRMQIKASDNALAKTALQDAVSRIESMGTLYDKLYKSEHYQDVSSKTYLGKLIDEIYHMFPNWQSVKIESNIDDYTMTVKEIFPLGLILNELITNAMKYAFPENRKGMIQITLAKTNRNVTLSFKDDGIGLPDSNDIKQLGFGLKLLDILTAQMNGNYLIKRNNGTEFIIRFTIQLS